MNRSILLSLYFYVLPLFNASLFSDVCDDEIRGRKFRHWLKNVTNPETSNSCCLLAAIFLCLINNITDTRVGFYMYGRNTARIIIAEESLSKPTDRG